MGRISNFDSVFPVVQYLVLFDSCDRVRNDTDASLIILNPIVLDLTIGVKEDDASFVVVYIVSLNEQVFLALDDEDSFLFAPFDVVFLYFSESRVLPSKSNIGFEIRANGIVKDIGAAAFLENDSLAVVIVDKVAA